METLIVLGGAGNIGIKLLQSIQNNNTFNDIYILDINIEPLHFLKNNKKFKIIKSDIILEN